MGLAVGGAVRISLSLPIPIIAARLLVLKDLIFNRQADSINCAL